MFKVNNEDLRTKISRYKSNFSIISIFIFYYEKAIDRGKYISSET